MPRCERRYGELTLWLAERRTVKHHGMTVQQDDHTTLKATVLHDETVLSSRTGNPECRSNTFKFKSINHVY
jgi:hypothetical protein